MSYKLQSVEITPRGIYPLGLPAGRLRQAQDDRIDKLINTCKADTLDCHVVPPRNDETTE